MAFRKRGQSSSRELDAWASARTAASSSDIDREWQPLLAAALAADQQLACAPVDVLKPQRGDLSDAQAQPRQQQQDREVAAPDRGRPIAAARRSPRRAPLPGTPSATWRPTGR